MLRGAERIWPPSGARRSVAVPNGEGVASGSATRVLKKNKTIYSHFSNSCFIFSKEYPISCNDIMWLYICWHNAILSEKDKFLFFMSCFVKAAIIIFVVSITGILFVVVGNKLYSLIPSKVKSSQVFMFSCWLFVKAKAFVFITQKNNTKQ